MDPVTKAVNAFRSCWNLLCDCDVFTDQSQSDVDQRRGVQEYYQEVFDVYVEEGDAGYKAWLSKLNWRTDISDDLRWILDSEEQDGISRLLNIYDNLREQGLV